MDTIATAVSDSASHYANSGDVGTGAVRVVMALFLAALVLALYLAPTLHARIQRHKDVAAIAIVNIFLGWSVVGWIWALIWANTSPGAHAELQPPPQPQRACLKCGVMNPLSGAFCSSCGARLGAQP